MTIIKPNQHHRLVRFLTQLFILMLLGGIFYVFEYNRLVSHRHTLKVLKGKIVEVEIFNADLKDKLYSVIDPTTLEQLAKESQLVLEHKPEYVKNLAWVSDSSY